MNPRAEQPTHSTRIPHVDSHACFPADRRLGRRRRGRVGQPPTIDGHVEPSSIATRSRPAVWTFEDVEIGSEGNRNGTDECSGRAAHPKAAGSRASDVWLYRVVQHARAARFECVSQYDQPSDDQSGPARRVGRDMPSEHPSCNVFLFRAARTYAASASPRAPLGTLARRARGHAHARELRSGILSSGAATSAAAGGRRSRPFSSPTVVERSWATGSNPSHGASRIDCWPGRPCDVRSPASDCSDPQMIRFRREIGRNHRLEHGNFATKGRFVRADGSGTVRDLQSPSTVAARAATMVRAVRFVRTLRCSRPVPRSSLVGARKHPSRNKLPRRLEEYAPAPPPQSPRLAPHRRTGPGKNF